MLSRQVSYAAPGCWQQRGSCRGRATAVAAAAAACAVHRRQTAPSGRVRLYGAEFAHVHAACRNICMLRSTFMTCANAAAVHEQPVVASGRAASCSVLVPACLPACLHSQGPHNRPLVCAVLCGTRPVAGDAALRLLQAGPLGRRRVVPIRSHVCMMRGVLGVVATQPCSAGWLCRWLAAWVRSLAKNRGTAQAATVGV